MNKFMLSVWIILLLPLSFYANGEELEDLSEEISENIQITLEVKRENIVERISFIVATDKFKISNILRTEPPHFISFFGSIKKKKEGRFFLNFKFGEDRPIIGGMTVIGGKTIPNTQYRNVSIESGISFGFGEELEIQRVGKDYIKLIFSKAETKQTKSQQNNKHQKQEISS